MYRREGLALRPLWSERPRCVTRGALRSWSADLSIFEVLLEPDGGARRRTAVVNLRHKQFTWAERSASAATSTAETTPTATAEATWTRYVSESGHAYLYCAATGESRWDESPA